MSEGNAATASPNRSSNKASTGTKKRTTAGSKHPKYEPLIREAIKAVQKPAKGAARPSITKYIIEKHGKTLGLHSRILVNLKLSLKRLAAAGTLIQSKPGWYRVSPAAKEAEKKQAADKKKKAAPKKTAAKKAKKGTKKAGAKKATKKATKKVTAGKRKAAATKKAAGAKKTGAKKAGAKQAKKVTRPKKAAPGTKKAATGTKRTSIKKTAAKKGTTKRVAKATTARKGARKANVAAKRAAPSSA